MTTEMTISRLRMANPAPLVPAADSPELFARITALPRDSRLARPARQPFVRRRRVALALVLGLLALLASTAFAISRWALGDAVKPRVTRHEYLRARHQLTLPPGVSWPDYHMPPPNTLTGRGAGGGQAVVISENAWECYWVRAIDRGNVSAQRRAHAELSALLAHNVIVAPSGASENWTPPAPPKTPYAVFADDGGLEWLRATYAAAAAGHPANLRQSCRANAPR